MIKSLSHVCPRLSKLLACVLVLVLATVASLGIIWAFPKAWDMVANADSLVLLELARDILAGKTIFAWNLPRAPYFFPDTVIALLVMAMGWFDQASFVLIASINVCLLVFLVCQSIQRSTTLAPVPPWLVTVLLILFIYVLGSLFPFAMSNLYWQLFASGAHFLTVIVVLGIFELVRPERRVEGAAFIVSSRAMALAMVIAFAEALSDSMSALLIFSWYGATVFASERTGVKRFTQYIALPIAVCLGTALSFLIPRQSLVESFFSLARFTQGITLFFTWLSSDYLNILFMALLLGVSIAFPFLMRGALPSTLKDFFSKVFGNYTLPALAVMGATPFFFQDIGSLRYLAFPGLITLLFFVIATLRVMARTRTSRRSGVWLISLFLIFMSLIFLSVARHRVMASQGQSPADLTSIAVGPAIAGNAQKAVQCIDASAKLYPLEDGIALYWNARPIFFASHFVRYLAQVSPDHPHGGYLHWGNNALEMAYKDSNRQRPRQYNYIVATNDELRLGLWGSLVAQSSRQFTCKDHTILFFENKAVLQAYLFPIGIPFDIAANGRVFKSNDLNQEWVAGPYWGNDLFTLVGVHQGMSILATGKEGFLVYGPYINLSPGPYRLIFKGHLTGPDKVLGRVEVVSHQGRLILATAPIVRSNANLNEVMQLPFDLKTPANDTEFRVNVNLGTTGTFSKFELIKLRGAPDSQ